MLTRMQDIKAGAIDEDGLGINNVETALARVNITLRDSDTSFRDMGGVLEELSTKWAGLNDIEQANIAKAIAGVRQTNMFAILMANMNDAIALQGEQLGSTGLALDRYGIYLESVEGSQNKMKASLEGLFLTAKGFDTLLINFYNITASVLSFVTAMGGLPQIMNVIVTLFVLLNKGLVVSAYNFGVTALASVTTFGASLVATIAELWAMVGAFGVAETATYAFNTALATSGWGLAVLAIGAIAGALIYMSGASERATKNLQKLNEELATQDTKIKSLEDKQKNIDTLAERYRELDKTVHKSTEETEEFVGINNALKKLVPELAGEFDDYGNFSLNATTENMDLLTTATEEQILAQKKLREATILAQMQTRVSNLMEASKKTPDGVALEGSTRLGGANKDEIEQYRRDIELARAKAEAEWADSLATEKENFKTWGKELQLEYINELRKTEFGKQMASEIFIPLMNEGQKILDEATPPEVEVEVKLSAEEAIANLTKDKDFKALVDKVATMLKDIANKEKDMWQEKIKQLNDELSKLKDIYQFRFEEEKRLFDLQKTNMQRLHEDEKRINDDKKDAVKDELDAYKKILNAQQEILRAKKAEDDYNQAKEDKQTDLARIEAQILELSFDNSAEGIARRLKLEEQAEELRKEMANDTADYEYDLQQQALDKQIELAEAQADIRIKELEEEQKASDLVYEMRLREIEDAQDKAQQEYEITIRNLEQQYASKESNFQNEIKLLDEYLSQEGLINKKAMDMILDENSTVYQELMDWNKEYGSGIDSDIIEMWDLAKLAVEAYKESMESIPAIEDKVWQDWWDSHYTPTENPAPSDEEVIHAHHGGINSGTVGGKKINSNEEFIKVLKGEVVITPKQMKDFVGINLPSMLNKPQTQSSMSGGNASFEKLFDIVIQGNMDKSVIPDLERLSSQIVDRINKGMQQRGMLRNTNLNAI